jgi:nucleoside-diphosphate-sugar epimerase
MKTVALTGATSMTGLALIRRCVNNDVNVIAFIRPDSKNLNKLPSSKLVQIIECNLENLNHFDLPESCGKADAFYHIGWINNTKEKRDSCRAQLENLPYAVDTVHMAKKMGCSRYIYLGSQAEVGLTNGPLNRNTFVDPVTVNGVAKYTAGKITSLECRALGLEHIWVRLVSEYGPNDHEDRLIKQFIKNCRDGIPMNLRDCTHIWDYLYEDDVGEALFLVGRNGRSGKIYILGSGTGRPMKEYLEIIRKKVNLNYVPNYGTIPDTETAVKYLVADISEITNDTGWQPKIPFEEGIDTVIRGK